MAIPSKVCALFVLTSLSCGLRRKSNRVRRADENPLIACPVMAAIVNSGLMTLDGQGRATQNETMLGLMATGNSAPMAQFQALGIAAFSDTDSHQEKRVRGLSSVVDDLYLNYDLWNPEAACTGSLTLSDGRPCNANIGFQQHGYSTVIRDPSDGRDAETRWQEWMDRPGVLVYDPSMSLFGKVMKIDGLGKLLNYARVEGNKDGEFALKGTSDEWAGSNLEFYHPNTGSRYNQLASAQWQAVGAWAAFWAAFAKYTPVTGRSFMPEKDLRRFFFEGAFPKGWTAKEWGFKESFKVVREMQGMGAGEEWTAEIVGILNNVGEEATEVEYMMGMLGALQAVGSRNDDVYRTVP